MRRVGCIDPVMPRLPRPIVPGQPLHITQRGNNRTQTFVDERDYRCYLDLLQLTRKRHGCEIHSYALMRNHVHLLITPEAPTSAARMMQELGGWYVPYFNRRHARTGTLWEGRFRSTLIDTERYFLACSRYIELNPVRAGVVDDPAVFQWSSFRANALGESNHLLTPHSTYRALGVRSAERQAAYRALFDAPLDPRVVDAFRRCTKRGIPLGGSRWTEHMEAVLQRTLTRLSHGGSRRAPVIRPGEATPDDREHHRFSTALTP
jgi:putative transposase